MKFIQKVIRKLFGEENKLYYWLVLLQYRWRPPLRDIDKILDAYANAAAEVRFVQVGSNDGKSGDPIFEYVSRKKWKGVLVEPVIFLFEQLKNNYAAYTSCVQFENAAIGKANGRQAFYRLRRSAEINAPQWYDQLGSFNKDVLLKHKRHIPEFEELLVTDEVETITMGELMNRHGLANIDLLHTDTEGYDFEIIKMFPFDRTKPGVILFEHQHFSQKDFKSCIRLLEARGYTLFSFDWDTIALHESIVQQFPDIVQQGKRNFTDIEKIHLLVDNRLDK